MSLPHKSKNTFKICLITALLSTQLYASPSSLNACKEATDGGSSVVEIFTTSLKTIYNVFPITIAGVKLNFFPNLEDKPSGSSSPICVCMKGPFPVPGITLSLWEPIAIVETTAIPSCFPTLGTSLNLGISDMKFQSSSKSSILSQERESYQAHYIKYPVFYLLGMFLDFLCLESSGGLDIGYMTEVDPLWQNDIWAAILGPEAYLVANPIAQTACMPDAVSSTMGFPLDPLWWCLGSWGSTFPMTENTKGAPAPETSAAIASRLLFKLHRQLMLWGSVGNQGLCGYFPMPLMMKSQYSMFPLYPIASHPYRIPIGRAGFLWNYGMESTMANKHVWAWAIYRKRDCCAL